MFRCLHAVRDDLHDYADGFMASVADVIPECAPTDYGLLRAGVVRREGRYQVELVTMRPGAVVPPHTHPGVDSIEVPLAGSIRLTLDGVDPFSRIGDDRLPGFVRRRGLRIPGDVVHGGAAHPIQGATFLSIQRWPEAPRQQLGENFVAAGMTSLPRARGSFRPVEAGDVAYVAARLREGDRREIAAVHGAIEPERALATCVQVSHAVHVGLAPDGEPISLLGVAPVSLLEGIGSPWMLGTDRVLDFSLAFVREGRKLVTTWLRAYPLLVNHVDARNATSVRWLRRLGFTIFPAEPYGVAGLPFHRFEMRG